MTVRHLTLEELNAGLIDILRSPSDGGALRLIVRRPDIDQREALQEGQLDPRVGLVGDTWHQRGSSRTEDGFRHPDMQLNIMNARVIALLAQSEDRWPLAGDQLFLDLDLTPENLPAGTRLALGSAVIEVTPQPHTGCGKFAVRFGVDATKFVNSAEGRRLHLRGINARVVQPGTIRVGDAATKLNYAGTNKHEGNA
ncbi:MAG: MOSC domain-containing protein [Acidobacteria bacterium]|nr:MOSC domain-containing protein [Acidobacteriota bacterium]